MSTALQKNTVEFLNDIAANNNRDWFQENKSQYEAALKNFKSFIANVESELSKYDEIEKTKIFRIYRDVRFSHDKTPYKSNFSAGFTRSGKLRRGGLFFRLDPDKAFVAGGFWNPESQDLKYIRDGISIDANPLRKAIQEKEFIERFGSLQGETLKSSPRGYDKDHPELDLINHKQFLVSREYSLKVALGQDFYQQVVSDYTAMFPMFNAIRDYLIFDGNGIER